MKNDSWLFPFDMMNDSFFDSNKDGKLSGFETIMRDSYWLEQQHRWNEQQKAESNYTSHVFDSSFSPSFSFEDRYAWREENLDFPEYGIYTEDYETREEYLEALEELDEKLEKIEELKDILDTPIPINIGLSSDGNEEIKPENYPNKRRFEAALGISENYFAFDSFRKAAEFINENADKILVANYISYNSGFLYSQAIKDNFDLPCSLPDEDVERKMDFIDILVKIAKRDIPLAIKIWEWCIEQFGPYVEYDEFSAESMSENVFENIYRFSNREEFIKAVVLCIKDNIEFGKKLMSLSPNYYYNVPEFIATALYEKQYEVAELFFKSELYKAKDDWKDIINLTDETIVFCSDGKQLESMVYFRDHFFPIIKAIPDGMVQDEIEEFENNMAEYIDDIESVDPKYAFSGKNAWRKTVPDGKEYGLNPLDYDSEEEYLEDYNEEKYGWRDRYSIEADEFGLDTHDFETSQEFERVLSEKRREAYEIKREAEIQKQHELWESKVQKQKEEYEKALNDKTVYTLYGVTIYHSARTYSFLADDLSIELGDKVIVPVGEKNEETEGTVVSIGKYLRLGAPYPIEKIKKIIRKK